MGAVGRPAYDAGTTFLTCITRIKNGELRHRLASVEPIISAAAKDYEVKAGTATLNLIATSDTVAGIVTKDEMVDVYDQRMAGKRGPGRNIYDRIKLLPK